MQQGRLGGAVGADVGPDMPGTLRAHVDDDPGVLPHPPPPGALHQPQRCLDVDRERLPPRIRAGLHQGAVGAVGRGVVDEDVQPSELAQHQIGQLLGMARARHVPGQSDPAQRGGRAPHLARVPRGHAHQRTGGRQRSGDGASDPARPTGDDGRPAFEPVRRGHRRTVS